MIILHFDLQPHFKYMNYFIYTSHQKSSIRGTSVIGRVFFKIEKTFIRAIALSTCIQALANFLVTITLSRSDICSSPELGGGISNVAHLTMRSSFIVKPLSATMIKFLPLDFLGGSQRVL